VYGGSRPDRYSAVVEARAARIMTWVALAIVLLEDAVYVLLIRSQGQLAPDAYTVPFVAGYLILMAALLAVSLVRPPSPSWRTPPRAGAAGGLLVLGILGAFSIGLPLILAGILATGASVRTLKGSFWAPAGLFGVAAAVAAVAVLVTGFEVTERMIVCPSSGNMSGGGTGLVTGPYHFECVDGRLSFHSG
jgi:hypothetical protein